MENGIAIHSAEQDQQRSKSENEQYEKFLFVFAQIVEKYGQSVLLELECVA